MSHDFLEDYQVGDTLTAKDLNTITAELRRQGKWAGQQGLVNVSEDQGGFRFDANCPDDGVWIKLTSGGTGGKYAWTKVSPDGSGGWNDAAGSVTGTTTSDPAIEQNGNTTITFTPNPVVRAWRDPASGTLQFQRGAC